MVRNTSRYDCEHFQEEMWREDVHSLERTEELGTCSRNSGDGKCIPRFSCPRTEDTVAMAPGLFKLETLA